MVLSGCVTVKVADRLPTSIVGACPFFQANVVPLGRSDAPPTGRTRLLGFILDSDSLLTA